ncbi:MAG: epoxyqueuosine reductase QueH [Deltaproteobacteria bacterium]|nr:epoxyqueuosine reductase QueH [Deltaproteobacteria bacterium]
MRMLLHACCCSCFSSVFEQIGGSYDLTVYFCNPNIKPDKEYARRLEELKNYPPSMGIKIVEGTRNFIELPYGPEGGERCRVCIGYRLNEVAKYSKENGFDIFATTLTVSPHKNSEMINGLGQVLSRKYGVEYLLSNFKKKNGYLRTVELSKQYGLYRQNYCGCTPKEIHPS